MKRDSTGLTSQILIQHLTEEVTVQSAIVKEKLPSELNTKRNRMKALSIVKEYSYLGPDKIMAMRNNLDAILKDIQDLVESKVSMHQERHHNISKYEGNDLFILIYCTASLICFLRTLDF